MLAGVWILTLFPLMDLLAAMGWDAAIPVPNLIDFHNTHYTLDQTFLSGFGLYPLLTFCMGTVLLFSKERGRQIHRTDWTGRWGIGCSYLTLLLGATSILFITALVLTGIGALSISMQAINMRARTQLPATQLLINISYAYLRYVPPPSANSQLAEISCSSLVILLGCVPLFEAIRTVGNKVVALLLLAPLVFFALIYLQQVARYALGSPASDVFYHEVYFRPGILLAMFPDNQANSYMTMGQPSKLDCFIECTKWIIVLTIAVWLTIAQVMTHAPSSRFLKQFKPKLKDDICPSL